MQYRSFGKTGLKLSILGFGCMRLPETEQAGKRIVDQEEAIRIIRRGIDLGINYVDTAFAYHGGESEEVVGEALQDGYRDKVILSTKSPLWDINAPSDYERILDEQLKKLRTDFLDIYYFHAVSKALAEEKILGLKLVERAMKAREDGRIRHMAFSVHDTPEVIKEIVDSGLMEGMLVQYNLVDQTNEEVIEYAKDKGMGVAVMGPVGGGRLAAPPEEIKSILAGMPTSTASLALRFVLSNPCVTTALSGMGSMQMVEENVKTASSAGPLAKSDKDLIEQVVREYRALCDLYCTSCGYCMPCPHEVNIPLNFKAMNDARVFNALRVARELYSAIGKFHALPGKPASECQECGECEEKCPQKIPIMKQLKEVHKELGETT